MTLLNQSGGAAGSRSAIDTLAWLIEDAFKGDPSHSLLANIRNLPEKDWTVLPPGGHRPVADILEHVAWSKWMYEDYAFGSASLRGPADEALLCKWLDRIACNVAFNHTRDQGRRPATVSLDETETPLAEHLPSLEPDPGTTVRWKTLQDKLVKLIQTLPDDLRAVLILRDIEGLSTAHTAGVLGIKEGLVKWRLNRARQRLREQLGDVAHFQPDSSGAVS